MKLGATQVKHCVCVVSRTAQHHTSTVHVNIQHNTARHNTAQRLHSLARICGSMLRRWHTVCAHALNLHAPVATTQGPKQGPKQASRASTRPKNQQINIILKTRTMCRK